MDRLNRFFAYLLTALVLSCLTVSAAVAAEEPEGLKRLDPMQPIWIDVARKRVVLVGKVCLREGQLEMLVCPTGTKEHESVLSVPVEASKVHAALLVVGAEPGNPARFVPDYRPARGTQVDVWLFWTDETGQRQRCKAQDWVRYAGTEKTLEHSWVFGGSGFWKDENTGEEHYQAETGDLICVSNFPTAMLDLPIESSNEAGLLSFEPYTERIPPLGTPVTIVLKPVLEEKQAASKE